MAEPITFLRNADGRAHRRSAWLPLTAGCRRIEGMDLHPSLDRVTNDGVNLLVDRHARDQGVVVAFSDRSGGVSAAPYESLNLSARVGDTPDAVTENRKRFLTAVGLEPDSLTLARQVHGCSVVDADAGSDDETPGDVVVSSTPGSAAGVLTADCVPILLVGDGRVAAVHAGWRGLVAGAIDAGIEAVGSPQAAWVGPSIHACCYEVGPDVVGAFEEKSLPVADSWHVDPGRAAFIALRRAGVERIASVSDCTSCDARYFSHRRDRTGGRQGALIALL